MALLSSRPRGTTLYSKSHDYYAIPFTPIIHIWIEFTRLAYTLILIKYYTILIYL